MPTKKNPVKKAEEAVKEEARKVSTKAKAAAKKAEDKAAAEKTEVRKAAAKTTQKAKTAVKETAAKVEKAVKKPAAKVKAAKPEIIVQSPVGGNITVEEIAAKIPADAEAVFVRVDQNKLWWVKGEESGNVDIWE